MKEEGQEKKVEEHKENFLGKAAEFEICLGLLFSFAQGSFLVVLRELCGVSAYVSVMYTRVLPTSLSTLPKFVILK